MLNQGLKPDIIGSIPDLSRRVPVELGPDRSELRLICCSSGFQQFFLQLYCQIQLTRSYRFDGFRNLADNIYIESNQKGWVSSIKEWRQFVKYFQKSLWNNSRERALRYELIRAWLKAEELSCKVILSMFSDWDELRRFSGYTADRRRYLFPWQ
jgi:hypothetical protein